MHPGPVLHGTTEWRYGLYGRSATPGFSAEFSDPNAANRVEVLAFAGDQSEAVFDRRGCDERIGQPRPELSNDPPGPLCDGAVDVEFAERPEHSSREFGRRVPGEQLGTGDNGVAETVTLRADLADASEVVNEDVGVDEEVSHVASRRARGRLPRVTLRTSR